MRSYLVFALGLSSVLVTSRLTAETVMTTDSGLPGSAVYGSFYTHKESRDSTPGNRVSESNLEFHIGFDYLISDIQNLYIGARGGVFRERVLTRVPVLPEVDNRLFVGGQAYKYFDIGGLVGAKFGAAADVVFGGNAYSLGFYTGALAGLRVTPSRDWYVEIPAELGVFPFFSGTPVVMKLGLQGGMRF